MTNLKALAVSALVATTPVAVSASTIAYEVPTGTVGTQNYSQILGMDFVVNQAINVLSLGAFDDYRSGAYGISAGTTLVTEIWSRIGNAAGSMLASLSFTASNMGTLVGSSRFQDLQQALTLTAGEYTVVSYGYNMNDLNANQGSWSPQWGGPWFTNDGSGLISFVGGSRYGGTGGTGIGSRTDRGPEDRYAAGTFTFEAVTPVPLETVAPVPLPASLPLLLGGFGLLAMARRRKA